MSSRGNSSNTNHSINNTPPFASSIEDNGPVEETLLSSRVTSPHHGLPSPPLQHGYHGFDGSTPPFMGLNSDIYSSSSTIPFNGWGTFEDPNHINFGPDTLVTEAINRSSSRSVGSPYNGSITRQATANI